jgi:GNAT superfamily N-acetyltransferase
MSVQTHPHTRCGSPNATAGRTAQLLRVYIAADHRRRGVARNLVEHARQFAEQVGYQTIYLHTNASVPGAEAFWRTMPTTLIYDGRGNSAGYSEAVHFELAVPDRPA